jgi:type IV pilus assembly protein PilB
MKRRVSDIMVELGFVRQEQVTRALDAADRSENEFNELLLKRGHITEEQLQLAIAVQEGAKLLDTATVTVDQRVLSEIPHDFLKTHNIFPFAKEGNILKAATNNPFDVSARDELSQITGYQVATYIAPQEWISKHITLYVEASQAIDSDIEKFSRAKRTTAARFGKDSLLKLARRLIEKGFLLGAGDIHVVPDTSLTRIYYRIDGALHQQYLFPLELHGGLVAAYKNMAGMDATRAAMPQEGRISYQGIVSDIDIRTSSLPTHLGETIVMRLLGPSSLIGHLKELGFEPDDLEVFKKTIQRPYGFIIAAGPAESGKTTTIYSALVMLNQPNVNIITVEDPIENTIPNVRQTSVNPEKGLTFTSALTSAMHQDPNIIFVGELKDKETTDLALQAAISGHLVFSTLRTNDAAAAITRLLDLGTNKNILASSLSMIVAQRLMRKICTQCVKMAALNDDDRELFIQNQLEPPKMVPKPVGCEDCYHTGYSGRTAIYEVVSVDRNMKELIFAEALQSVFEEHAVQHGTSLFPRQALKKVINQLTTLEEVYRIIAIS